MKKLRGRRPPEPALAFVRDGRWTAAPSDERAVAGLVFFTCLVALVLWLLLRHRQPALASLAVGDVSALTSAFGHRVVAGRRGRFRAADGTEDEFGFLELTFDSGDVVVLDVASDWTLVASSGPWVDHFAEPLDDDNREFVRTHGKWSPVELSTDLAEALVGADITLASLMHDETGDFVGVRLVTRAVTIVAACDQDGELQIKVERG